MHMEGCLSKTEELLRGNAAYVGAVAVVVAFIMVSWERKDDGFESIVVSVGYKVLGSYRTCWCYSYIITILCPLYY
ncbi:hypothetical protein JYU34_009519 [Plutella xylostella]|uniref:Uncharacterized protein n=1 Tax=Plutella xylostella TaxID=51655 RepID=A0ABQ7QJS4_PLUXY|nr:hypothetical protein JYU34_009519 [Plutella xylostella]